MSNLRKAAEMALEALRNAEVVYMEQLNAMYALQEALAQPEQEPVAWMHNFIADNVITHKPADIVRNPERWTALYPEPKPCPTCEALARTVMMDQTAHDTAPPKREWVGLTDDEFTAIARKYSLPTRVGLEYFKDELESKLKEKNT